MSDTDADPILADDPPEVDDRWRDAAGERSREPEVRLQGEGGVDEGAGESDGQPGRSVRDDGVAEDRIGARITIGEANQSKVIATGVHTETHHNYAFLSDYAGELPLWPRDLEPDHFDEVLDRDRLATIGASFVAPDGEVEAAAEILERHRIAFVVGERGLGKGGLAQLVASRIANRDADLREALVAAGLDRGIRVRPEHLFGDNRDLADRLLLFEDAFRGGNEDLCRLAERLDGPGLEALRRCLIAAGAYLLLTSDLERFPARAERLEGLGLVARVEQPSPDAVLGVLSRRASRPGGGGVPEENAAAETLERLIASRGPWLAGRLRTVPRAVEWVDRYLPAVSGGDLGLEESLDRLDNLDYWLFTELPADPPAWHFVLALLLASAHPRFAWVPLLLIHRLWRRVEEIVERELTHGKVTGPRPLSRLVVNAEFLARARAEVRRRPYPSGDAVRFGETALADQLWRVLLTSGRSLAVTLLPLLGELADSSEVAMRRIAARSLGRLGELDPASVTFQRIGDWLEAGGDDRRFETPLLVGELLVGAARSDDESYLAKTLERIQAATASRPPRQAAGAVAALVPLGMIEPQRVLGFLWDVAQKRVAESARRATPLWRKVQQSLEHRARSKDNAAAGRAVVLSPSEAEEAALATLGDRASAVLDGIQYVLVGLCFGGEATIEVARAMIRWMRTGEELSAWIGFLALRRRGVLRILEDHPIEPPAEATSGPPEGVVCSRLLLSADGDEEIAALVELLESVHAAAAAFPASLRSWLRKNFLEVLNGWVAQGAAVPAMRSRVIAMFAGLLEATDETLRSEVFGSLQRRVGGPESAERTLAREVLNPF